MNLLLDTHVVVWALSQPTRIPPRVRKLLEAEADAVFVSHISLWEIGMKYPLRRRDTPPRSAAETLEDVVAAGFQLIPLDLGHILAFERLPLLHGDPFDRLLVAQAMAEGLSLVTHDRQLGVYGDMILAW